MNQKYLFFYKTVIFLKSHEKLHDPIDPNVWQTDDTYPKFKQFFIKFLDT